MTNETNTPADATTTTKTKTRARRAAPAKRETKTFRAVDLAREMNISPKTLRARIRRNIDKFAPLFHNNVKHTFADNAKTRAAVKSLLS